MNAYIIKDEQGNSTDEKFTRFMNYRLKKKKKPPRPSTFVMKIQSGPDPTRLHDIKHEHRKWLHNEELRAYDSSPILALFFSN